MPVKNSHVFVPVGSARIVGAFPVGDGTFLDTIHGFCRDDRGLLRAGFRAMPLIPDEWRGSSPPAAFENRITALIPWMRWGQVPELLILTDAGSANVWRYTPWTRDSGGSNPGLTEVQYAAIDGTFDSIEAGSAFFPPTYAVIGGAVYWTFGDGGRIWQWDGEMAVPVGCYTTAAPPTVHGPQPGTSENSAGFSVRGRIGTTNGDWQTSAADGAITVGGLEDGEWRYFCVYEMADGSYSRTSVSSSPVRVQHQLADPADPRGTAALTRRFRVIVPSGPDDCRARILLRTRNLRRLGTDSGLPRFLVRIPHNLPQFEYVDDLPDGELGYEWPNREAEPVGVRLLGSFDGSLWRLGSTATPARAWFSERSLVGPVAGSIGPGHWLDIYPATGPITAFAVASLAADRGVPTALVFKPAAVHFLAGSYPNYQVGTLHEGAGCAGPGGVRTCPDGSVIWFSAVSRTFWRWTPNEGVVDVGASLRRILRRINVSQAAFMCSWVNAARGEVVFVLPIDDELGQSFQFIWDVVAGGWRTDQNMSIRCAAVFDTDGILVGGTLDGVANVLWYGIGRGNYDLPAFTWELRTAWTPAAGGALLFAEQALGSLLYTGEDASATNASGYVYINWNAETPVDTEGKTFYAAEPRAAEEGDIAFVDSAEYDVAVWRTPRVFAAQVMLPYDAAMVVQIGITGTAPWTLAGLWQGAAAPQTAPGARTAPLR